ncbi:MAG: Cna B-type domain-containing protein, partial [Oscillibacter sp.]|nr:Cna B-type domain-containing protein [Oscillibacter sp.]
LYQSLSEEEQNLDVVVSAYIRVMAVYEQYTGVMAQLMDGAAAQIGDNAYDTLQEAVSAAQDGDVIVLLKPVAESITVSKSVTFDLNGQSWTGKDTATLTVNGVNNVTVKNGTMTAVENFKAIEAKSGTLVLDGITFSGITTKQGAVNLSASTAGALTAEISNCTFTQNVKAIYASKVNLTLNNCEIVENNNLTWGNGAAVYFSSSTVAINGGKVSDNTCVERKIIEVAGGSLVMDGTKLTNNTGSGVVGTGSAADITMRNVVATGNIGTSSMNSGGSVLNANSINGKTVILENVTATGNRNTKEHGGAFYLGGSSNDASTVIEITGCTITGNTAAKQGGGIYVNNKGTTTITDTVIAENTANWKLTTNTTTFGNAGGGLYVASTTGTVTLAGSTRIYNNLTPNDKKIPNTTNGGSADIALASTTLTSSTNAKNPDSYTRATLVLNGETSFTGDNGTKYTLTQFDRFLLNTSNGWYYASKKYSWPMGYYTVEEEPVHVYLGTDGQHTGDKAVTATTLADAVKTAKEHNQDTVYVCGNFTVDMASAVSLNSGITFARCSEHPNGHMFTINGDITLNNAHIDGMNVRSNSSMIYVPSNGHLTITGNTLIENGKNVAEKGKGGAIYVSQGQLTMEGGTITNSSACEGGGIYAFGGKLVAFEGGKVSNNTATGGNGGGGAYIEATSSEFGVHGGRTYFEGNVSNQLGGGVFLVNGTNAHTHHFIYKATFTGNRSLRTGYYYDGGAIYIQSGTTAHMKNVYVSGNTDSDPWLAHNNYTAVAVCPTGELAVYELDGLLAVNNNGKVDIGVVAGGTVSSVDPMVYLPSYAPGGGSVSYTYSNGNPVELDEHQFTKGYFRVKTIASDSAIASARATAEADGVVITGNYATQFGAGIMTNGTLKIGTETTTLRVNKVWKDGNENHANDRIVVYLTQDGKIVDQDFRDDASVVLCEENNWSYTWTNLGDQFEWGVQEAAVPGYSSEVKVEKDTEFSAIADKYYIATITNTPSTEESERLVISKTAYGLDPDASYKFTLKLDNVGDKVFSIQLPDGSVAPIYNNEITFYLKDGQSAVVEGLPAGYTYEVTEEENPAYKSFTFDSVTEDVNGSITSVMVVNLPLVSITVQKLWNDTDDAAFRPESITVNLMNGEMVMDTAVVTPDENGNWFHTFADLPEYDAEGNKIAYTVKEVGADDYDAKYELNTDGVWVITNTLRRGSLTINKAVVGGGGEAANKEFTFTVTGADENTKDYKETVTIKGAGTGVLQGLLPGAYTVTEADASISGYTWNVSGTGSVTVEANKEAEDTTNVNVTNTYTENKPLDGSLTITKVIRGGGSEAQNKTYTFTVTGPDGYNRTVTITGEGSVTLSPLTPGVYTVTEDRAGAVISGYTLTISGSGSSAEVVAGGSADVTVTNTYTTPGGG